MHENICGVSAFRLHRTPPQVQLLSPHFPSIDHRAAKYQLGRHPEMLGHLGAPLHVLVQDRKLVLRSKAVITHLWTEELPSGSFMENELDITLATPAFTLLTMAPSISRTHLLMAAYELCGDFTVFRPTPEMQRELDRLPAASNGWRQVRTTKGTPSTLWRRPPLIEVGELVRFVEATAGMRGHKNLAWAARHVTGIASSPLEVQASIRLGIERCYGGEGLKGFENNRRIPLSTDARRLAGQNTCYADLYFEGDDAHGPLDIECHGHMAHDGAVKGELDANRTLALQSMGIEVVLLTYEQLSNQERFDSTARHIAELLGTKPKPKTERMQEEERRLARQLFIDWETLGS